MSLMLRSARRVALAATIAAATLGGSFAPNGWTPVPAPAAFAADSAVIAHAEDGLSLRAEPAYGSDVLATLANGTPVTLRTSDTDTVYDPDGETRWWPVRTDAGDGWVSGFYLELGGWQEPAAVAGADAADAPQSASEAAIAAWEETAPALIDGDGWNLAGATAATVSNPDGVNLRGEPGLAGELLTTVAGGSTVDLRVDEAETVYADGSRWWPVSADGMVGWISGDYLEPASWSSGATTPELSNPAPSADAAPAFTAGDYVEVATDDGGDLNIRADGAPDAERVGMAPASEVIQVMDGPTIDPLGNPWYMITDGDVTGWVFGQYLARADGPPSPDSGDAPQKKRAKADVAGTKGDNFPFGDDDPFGEGFPFGDKGVATGNFMYPLSDYIFTQGFGCTGLAAEPWEPSLGCNFHNGIDLAANEWTPVYAADGGIVELAGWCDCGLGYYVKIDHGNGFKTVYGHLVAYDVVPGEAVAKGERIASVGTTGNSTGSHLHFITQYQGVPYNPLWYMPS